MADIIRVATGIPGFDELIYEGLPKRTHYCSHGTRGSGKPTFGMAFDGRAKKESFYHHEKPG